MNDLRLVHELIREVPLPTPDELAPARGRLVAELSAGTRPHQQTRRRLLAAGLAFGVAASITAAAFVVSTSPRSGQLPAAAAGADVLTRAAAVARALPDITTRPVHLRGDRGRFGHAPGVAVG